MTENTLLDRAEEDEILQGLRAFIDRRVIPAQEEIGHLFNDARQYFGDDDKERPQINEARKAVRMASAEAGFYTLFTPTELGGTGLGNEFYMRCVEMIGRAYGPGEPREPLAAEVLANWFSGPAHLWMHADSSLRDVVLP